MADLATRFEAKVDRSGEHHLWTGSRLADGSGQLRVDGKLTTARRVAWELVHGSLPSSARVLGCPAHPACVRLDHLSVRGGEPSAKPVPAKTRAPRGSGTKRQVRPGVWKLTVTAGRWADGSPRRVHRTVRAGTDAEASAALADFAAEVSGAPLPDGKDDRDITVDEAVERFLIEHLVGEKGREESTVAHYRSVHGRWFSREIGRRRLRDIDEATIDWLFGRMRKAGLSASRMNDARSLYAPLFRWAKRRRIVARSPMADFELPTSRHVAREHVPPEVDQLCRYLEAALEVVPDVAPVLTLGAVTGMRRGELVGLRRSRLYSKAGKLVVDAAYASGGRVKTTKTRKERQVAIDEATMAMLLRHGELMDERAALFGVTVPPDGFVFSLEPDCCRPMEADHVTKQVARLKDHVGIADKRPETIALEDEALRLYRSEPAPRRSGRSGPAPAGGLSFKEIGRRLRRSERWAQLAVASAGRREAADRDGRIEMFDGSIIALRKFTSSELLDAGFNLSAVAQRQGHGPQVLVKHDAKARPSADRKAAEHLGQVVHGGGSAAAPSDQTR
ncbi:MAG: tyrosine-type recombinase/integrase [Acidimicrobiales bacterium]